jgi:hypothetical protein
MRRRWLVVVLCVVLVLVGVLAGSTGKGLRAALLNDADDPPLHYALRVLAGLSLVALGLGGLYQAARQRRVAGREVAQSAARRAAKLARRGSVDHVVLPLALLVVHVEVTQDFGDAEVSAFRELEFVGCRVSDLKAATRPSDLKTLGLGFL